MFNRNGAGNRNNVTNMAGVHIGETVGTVSGTGARAALGSLFGPLGTVAGAIAGCALGNEVGEGAEGNNGATNRTQENDQH